MMNRPLFEAATLRLTTLDAKRDRSKSSKKIGFKVEELAREALHREGKRWDMIFMGLLRQELINPVN